MVRTQIQLPDDLYRRAKEFGAAREISLAELTRRGLEMLLSRYPRPENTEQWRLPRVNGGRLKVPLEQLREIAAEDEENSALACEE